MSRLLCNFIGAEATASHITSKPIRKGVISHTLMVEDLGRRSCNNKDVYVLRLYSRLDETKKGEIACHSAEDSRQWIEAFEHVKQQVEHDLLRGDLSHHINAKNELNLDGHQNRVRRYTHGLRRLIGLGRVGDAIEDNVGDAIEDNVGDTIDCYLWKCVHTVNGIRIFEDVTESKDDKCFLVKSVAVVNAGLDTVFETIYNLDKRKRYEWDTLTSDLECAEEVDGHFGRDKSPRSRSRSLLPLYNGKIKSYSFHSANTENVTIFNTLSDSTTEEDIERSESEVSFDSSSSSSSSSSNIRNGKIEEVQSHVLEDTRSSLKGKAPMEDAGPFKTKWEDGWSVAANPLYSEPQFEGSNLESNKSGKVSYMQEKTNQKTSF